MKQKKIDQCFTVIIGISGGTGSGKTTFAKKIDKCISSKLRTNLIQQDNFYKDRSHLSVEERECINFDHPNSIDIKFLGSTIFKQKKGEAVFIPQYDFLTHSRKEESLIFNNVDVVIVEGTLIYINKKLRNLFDYKIFLEVDDDIRFIRRLERDIQERGRTCDKVINQYIKTVRPMHKKYVEPSKKYADSILLETSCIKETVDFIYSLVFKKKCKNPTEV